MSQIWTVRRAVWADTPAISRQNAAMAMETEGKILDPDILHAGVQGALERPNHVRYWVASAQNQIIGQAMTTPEWSDWRNGWIWWLQSVYVESAWRGKGVFASLVDTICADAKDFAARESVPVVGLRLYVENENQTAQEVYRRLGFENACYQVMEMPGPHMEKRTFLRAIE